ncbi:MULTISPECIES: MurR/RpiR family transcriptional regulator [Paraburkholderia]|uniref:MurR/RpiR family transcriptional regulator n=1 Tax=Paraburkholderia TaxID=1822464 RepID=UPI002AB68CD1|nr:MULTISPECIES: MurR/RpiR family transcriptional regulator [Paraburkholderia]
MKVIATPPRTREQFLRRIAQEFDGISGRLKLIAQSVDQHCEDLGHMGIRMFAQHCGVHPSAVVRFAHHFGFSGFSDMRALFRSTHVQDVSLASSDNEPDASGGEHRQLADEFLVRSIAGLENLRRTFDRPEFARAVIMLERTEIVWIVGANRAFPVAVHLEHALRLAGKRVGHLGAFESLTIDQARAVRAGDLIVAISVGPCAQEIAEIVRYGLKQDAGIIAITDSRLSQVGRAATVSLIVGGSVNSGFDFITAATSLVQCLCAALFSSYVEHPPDARASGCDVVVY